MRNQDPAKIGCSVNDVWVWYTDDPCRVGILKIDGPLMAAQATNGLLVEVGVSLESRPHALGVVAPWRAASSLE
jgi:hypothetical protein